MMIGVFHEAGIDFHLPAQHRFQRLRHVVPRRDFLVARGELALWRNDTQRLLPREGLLAELVPALVELALVLVGPFRRHVVRGVGGAGREVGEERLVGRQRLLLRDPGHGLVGHVLHEVVALFGRLLWIDRRGAFVDRRVPLVRLAAEEAIEILEAAAARRPGIERSDRAGFPHRHFVALAELRRGVAVELQRPCQRRNGVREHRAITRRAAGDLGDAAHAGGMVVAPGQQRLAGRRAEGGGVEAVVFQAVRGQLLRGRRLAGAAEGARRAKPCIVKQDEQDIRRAFRGT